MLSLDVDLVHITSLVAKKMKAGLISHKHRRLCAQIEAVAEKYQDVFSTDTPVQVMNPEALTEAEMRSHVYSPDQRLADAAISALGVKNRAVIQACRDILNGRFAADGAVPDEPDPIPIYEKPGQGMLAHPEVRGRFKHYVCDGLESDTGAVIIEVQGENVCTVITLDAPDVKEKFIIEWIAGLIPSRRLPFTQKSEDLHSDLGMKTIKSISVKISSAMRQELAEACRKWDKENPYYRGYIFWLDTGIVSISVVEENARYSLCGIDMGRSIGSGKMLSRFAMTHMVENSSFSKQTMANLRSYLSAHKTRNRVALQGIRGFVWNGSHLIPTVEDDHHLHDDLLLKQFAVKEIFRHAGINEAVFGAWDNRRRLYSIMHHRDEIVSYGNKMRAEIHRYLDMQLRELEYLKYTADGSRRRTKPARNRQLRRLIAVATSNIDSFRKRLVDAVAFFEFPEEKEVYRQLPFRHRQVDWYSEWLTDFKETNSVRRVHIKGDQLRPIVFEGYYEDLLVLGDGRAVCIIIKPTTPTRRARLRALVSETATTHNVLYATFILSRLAGMESAIAHVLEAGKEGLNKMVKSTERLTREIIRQNRTISLMDIEREVDLWLPHLRDSLKATVTRTVTDLMLCGPVAPRIKCVRSLSPCYFECIHPSRVESRGTLLLDNLVPVAGAKVWSSHGELGFFTEVANTSDLMRLCRQSGDRWKIMNGGRYRPQKDTEFIADTSMRCG